MATTAISRNSNFLRRTFRHFSSAYQWRQSEPLFRLLPPLPKPLPPSFPQSDKCVGEYGMRSIAMIRRYLSTTTADPPGKTTSDTGASSNEANQANDTKEAEAGSSERGSSGGGKQSGDSNNDSEKGRSIRGGPVSWISFLLLVATGAGILFYYDQEKKRHIEGINSASSAIKQGPSAGKAAIGGPFKLVNHDGKSVTENDFKGKWTLIYFGFTHCPDICPDELQKLATAVDKIKTTAGIEIVPVFISVDPERDTVEQVREYVKEFHPKLIGLTGSADEVKKVALAYRVYYMKTEEEGSDYLVDHSIIMYLMDPNMNFVKFFGKNNDVDALSEGIIKEIKQNTKSKGGGLLSKTYSRVVCWGIKICIGERHRSID